MKSFRIYPYGPSTTASDLTEGLDGLLIKREGSKYAHRVSHRVINWGSATQPSVLANVPVLNKFSAVAIAISKLKTYIKLHENNISIPEVTDSQARAQEWLVAGDKVVGRDRDSGRSGAGITIYHPRNVREVGAHPFYTRYWKKEREFRIHVLNGNVIFEQEKVKHEGVDADPYVRSHTRGWGFAFNRLVDNPVPGDVRELGKQAVAALELDFGAVDIGWNNHDGGAVFEVNTAPGLENTSLAAYINAFKEMQ